jgi:myo-inositol 2-dehydrogenase / D-chiro-inositol 1-dehydrogenase
MSPLRVGVIGCGRAGYTHHLPALASVEEAEAVAVADPDAAALGRAAERFGVAARFDDYRELLADESIEAVCVACPTHLHAEVGLATLDAGKHVLVEKPLALSLEDCDRMVARAAASEVKAIVGFNMRHHRHVRRARDLIRGGELGRLRMLTSTWASASLVDVPQGWRSDPSRGGGLLAMQAVHHLDLWRFLLGEEIEDVFCSPSEEPGSAFGPGTAGVVGTSAGGVGIAGSFCAVTGQENAFAVYGSEAWLDASLYRFDRFEVMPREATGGDLRYRARRPMRYLRQVVGAAPYMRRGGDFNASYQDEWRHLAEAIRRDGPVDCGFEDARGTTRLLLASLESAATGRAVRVEDAPGDPDGLSESIEASETPAHG